MANDTSPLKTNSIFKKISNFIKKPQSQQTHLVKIQARRALLRMFNYKPYRMGMSLTYQPDSQVVNKAYPEFDKLFAGFIRYNKGNNAGGHFTAMEFYLKYIANN